jgi:hypothetical protein
LAGSRKSRVIYEPSRRCHTFNKASSPASETGTAMTQPPGGDRRPARSPPGHRPPTTRRDRANARIKPSRQPAVRLITTTPSAPNQAPSTSDPAAIPGSSINPMTEPGPHSPAIPAQPAAPIACLPAADPIEHPRKDDELYWQLVHRVAATCPPLTEEVKVEIASIIRASRERQRAAKQLSEAASRRSGRADQDPASGTRSPEASG